MKHKTIIVAIAATLQMNVACNNATPEQNSDAKADSAAAPAKTEALPQQEEAKGVRIKTVKAYEDQKLKATIEFQYNGNGLLSAVKNGEHSVNMVYKREKGDSLVVVAGKSDTSLQAYNMEGTLYLEAQRNESNYCFDVKLAGEKAETVQGREFGLSKEFQWKDGNMVKHCIYDEETVTTYEYTYGELPNLWNFNLIGYLDCFDEHNGFFSSENLVSEYLSKNLPSAVDYTFSDESDVTAGPKKKTCKFEYTLDNQKRVKTINMGGRKTFEVEYCD